MQRILSFIAFASLVAGCAAQVTATGAASGGAVVYAQAQHVNLSVTNGSSSEICYLYISPVSDPNWGPDVLGARTLSPGETDTYELGVGQWDIKAEDCAHNQLFVMRNATIASNSTLVLHD